ncbi:expressed unknown protein [Seminavis robusta]|uniref:MYND-type domain-containing protein n=1 Tax=Seminavis robusta TaxID=568900 RepID=A0A9N8DAB6_9STRA|nr:expressed unknown protein [Seminavis robusta]|eukprot:Sro1_g000180.1 n/a (152) ;mRNA; r:63497-63952
MEEYAAGLEQLPDPSPSNDPSQRCKVSSEARCHGCGDEFEIDALKRCSKCKRVWYCSKACQVLDYKSPRNHKRMCREDLLSIAIQNIYCLPVEQKMALMAQGRIEQIPNNQFCQTVARICCPGNLDVFIDTAFKEFQLLRNHYFDEKEDVL